MNYLPVIQQGRYLLFESSDEEEEEEKIWGFAEETIPRFSDKQFKFNFRMSPATFENLMLMLTADVNPPAFHRGNQGLPLDKQVLMTIWCLANVESFRSVGLKFGVTKSTCWEILYKVSHKLLHASQRYGIISWPSRDRSLGIIQGFEAISQFPGVIGAIDGCHIQINKPQEHPNSNINRKGYASVLLQGVCDHRKLFIDVFVGVPGSVHDQRLFRISDLSQKMANNTINFPNNSHLIGDLAYVLSEKLIVGFKNQGNLTNVQRNFNFKLNRARVVIEHAFAYLKGRFRRFKMLETVRQDLIALLIVAGCILHNICIYQEDLPEEYVQLQDEIVEDQGDFIPMGEEPDGRIKRNTILQQLQNN